MAGCDGVSAASTVCVLIITLCASHIMCISARQVTVKTNSGIVIGQRLPSRGLNSKHTHLVDTFIGIPFAQAPVGKLRFQLPQPHPGWQGELHATTEPPICIGKAPHRTLYLGEGMDHNHGTDHTQHEDNNHGTGDAKHEDHNHGTDDTQPEHHNYGTDNTHHEDYNHDTDVTQHEDHIHSIEDTQHEDHNHSTEEAKHEDHDDGTDDTQPEHHNYGTDNTHHEDFSHSTEDTHHEDYNNGTDNTQHEDQVHGTDDTQHDNSTNDTKSDKSDLMLSLPPTDDTKSDKSHLMLSLPPTDDTESDNTDLMVSLPIDDGTKSDNTDMMLSLPADSNTESDNTDMMLSLPTDGDTKSDNTDMMLSLPTDGDTESDNTDLMLSLPADSNTESDNTDMMLSLPTDGDTKSDNTDLMLSLTPTDDTKSDNSDLLLSLPPTDDAQPDEDHPMSPAVAAEGSGADGRHNSRKKRQASPEPELLEDGAARSESKDGHPALVDSQTSTDQPNHQVVGSTLPITSVDAAPSTGGDDSGDNGSGEADGLLPDEVAFLTPTPNMPSLPPQPTQQAGTTTLFDKLILPSLPPIPLMPNTTFPGSGTTTEGSRGPFGPFERNSTGSSPFSRQEGPFGGNVNRRNSSSTNEEPSGNDEGPFGLRTPEPPPTDLPDSGGPFGRTTPGLDGRWQPGTPMNMTGPGSPVYDPVTDEWAEYSPWTWEYFKNFTGDEWNGIYAGPLAPSPWIYAPKALPEVVKPSKKRNASEDCLFLNIFSPKPDQKQKNITEKAGLPVLVFFHDGDFTNGNALDLNLINFAIETESIVVTVAYRLHVFGFFWLPDSQLYPGNMGLWDQVLALQWVHDNIKAFGGDISRITIAGYGSGASAVAMHLVSPASTGLFTAAISASGAKLDLRADADTVRDASLKLLAQLQCAGMEDAECVQMADEIDVEMAADELTFLPFYDKVFFPDDPWKLISSNNYNKVPYLLGLNSDEGLTYAVQQLRDAYHELTDSEIRNMAEELIESDVEHYYDFNNASRPKTLALIRQKYLSDVYSPSEAFREAVELYSDLQFVFPTKRIADRISTMQQEVYMYYFNHTPSYVKKDYEKNLQMAVGAGHIEPLHLLYGNNPELMNEAEKRLSSDLLTGIRMFLHYRKPSLPVQRSGGDKWPAYNPSFGGYVEFGIIQRPDSSFTSHASRHGFPSKSVTFWSDVIPAILRDSINQYCAKPILMEHPPDDISTPDDIITIMTSHGIASGRVVMSTPTQAVGTRRIHEFLGIPYAASPVGARRFRDAVPVSPWHGVYNATQFAAQCPQQGTTLYSEDCLHLNVWAPDIKGKDTLTLLPVIVYIHGGNFLTGSGNKPSLKQLAARMSSIVVSVNFRLGVLGFLSLGDGEFPGNYAHTDIIMALRWVQENIYTFGGHPGLVTLLGFDSGAALAAQIAMSHHSAGLLSAVITMGGSAQAPWAVDDAPEHTAITFAAELDCPITDPAAMMHCLLAQDVSTLVQAQVLPHSDKSTGAYTSPLTAFPWRPTITGLLDWSGPLSDTPVTFLMGSTKHEGYQMYQHVVGNNTDQLSQQDFLHFLRQFATDTMNGGEAVYESLRTEYFPDHVTNDQQAFKNSAIAFFTDWAYLAPLIATTSRTENWSFYIYSMDFVPHYNPSHPDLVIHLADSQFYFHDVFQPADNLRGGTHRDSFFDSLFPSSPGQIPEKDKIDKDLDKFISSIFLQRITEFLKTREPNFEHSDPDLFWLEYVLSEKILRLNLEDLEDVDASYDTDTTRRLHLWSTQIPFISNLLTCNSSDALTQLRRPKTLNVRRQKYKDVLRNDTTIKVSEMIPNVCHPGIFGLGLIEAQVLVLALAGVGVLLLLLVVILSCVTYRLYHRCHNDTTVILHKDIEYATKM